MFIPNPDGCDITQEYQALHPDAIWGMLEKHAADYDMPPAVTAQASSLPRRSTYSKAKQALKLWVILAEVNFVLEDLTAINGPMRVVPGSNRWRHRPPTLREAGLRGPAH